jgi:hypothetical protein
MNQGADSIVQSVTMKEKQNKIFINQKKNEFSWEKKMKEVHNLF